TVPRLACHACAVDRTDSLSIDDLGEERQGGAETDPSLSDAGRRTSAAAPAAGEVVRRRAEAGEARDAVATAEHAQIHYAGGDAQRSAAAGADAVASDFEDRRRVVPSAADDVVIVEQRRQRLR